MAFCLVFFLFPRSASAAPTVNQTGEENIAFYNQIAGLLPPFSSSPVRLWEFHVFLLPSSPVPPVGSATCRLYFW
jgi:hypothetical protein